MKVLDCEILMTEKLNVHGGFRCKLDSVGRACDPNIQRRSGCTLLPPRYEPLRLHFESLMGVWNSTSQKVVVVSPTSICLYIKPDIL